MDSSFDSIDNDSIKEDENYPHDSTPSNEDGIEIITSDNDSVEDATIVSNNGFDINSNIDDEEKCTGSSENTMIANLYFEFNLISDDNSRKPCAVYYGIKE